MNGTTKKLKISKFVVCDQCGGSGARTPSGVSKCKTCNGTGVVTEVVDSFFGRTQTQRACPTCQGSGEVITDPCPKCKGEGVVRGEEVVEIKIPAGVGEGMQLSVSGKGNAARRGGINGDLLVVIEEERDPQLVRDGNDLLHSHKISIPTAVLGGTIEVPTVEGRAKVKVAAGTKAGSVLRLRGKGIPDINGRAGATFWSWLTSTCRRNSLSRSGRRSNSLAQSPSFGTPDKLAAGTKYIRAYAEFLQIRSIFVRSQRRSCTFGSGSGYLNGTDARYYDRSDRRQRHVTPQKYGKILLYAQTATVRLPAALL